MTEIKNDIREWVIYKITSPSGRIYIGKTADYDKRIYQYKHCSQKKQRHLYYSFKKYRFDSHYIEIIDRFTETLNYSSGKEMFWIKTYMSNYSKYPEMRGMNLTDGGEGFIGVKHTEETKRKQSDIKKAWHSNPNNIHHNKGKKASEATKLKQSLAKIGKEPHNKGKAMPIHQIELLRKINKGKVSWNKGKSYSHLSVEERNKLFGSHNIGNFYNKGRKHTKEIVEARASNLRGKPNKGLFKPILKYGLSGNFIKEYISVNESSKDSGLHPSTVIGILKNRIIPRKFIFKYKVV